MTFAQVVLALAAHQRIVEMPMSAPAICATPPAGNAITPSTPPLAAMVTSVPRAIFALEVCANLASLHSTVTTTSYAQMIFVMPPLAAITSTMMPTIAATTLCAPRAIIA